MVLGKRDVLFPTFQPAISPPQCHRQRDLGVHWDPGLPLPLDKEEPPASNGMGQGRPSGESGLSILSRKQRGHPTPHPSPQDTRAAMTHSHPTQPDRYSYRPRRKQELSLQPAMASGLFPKVHRG